MGFAMLLNTLTDAELRRIVDVGFNRDNSMSFFDDLAAMREAVRRFIASDEAMGALEARIEELEREVENLEYELREERMADA